MNVRRVILASVCALLCGCTSPTPPRSASAVLYIISGQTYIFVRPDASVGTRVNYVQHEWYFPDLNVALVTGSQGPNTPVILHFHRQFKSQPQLVLGGFHRVPRRRSTPFVWHCPRL